MGRTRNLKKSLVISLFLLAMECGLATGKTIYVDAGAPPGGDGLSWATACQYLQDALADAYSSVKPVEIRIAEGIYKPDRSTADPNGSGSRSASFVLIDGVTIEGGYAGFGAVSYTHLTLPTTPYV